METLCLHIPTSVSRLWHYTTDLQDGIFEGNWALGSFCFKWLLVTLYARERERDREETNGERSPALPAEPGPPTLWLEQLAE